MWHLMHTNNNHIITPTAVLGIPSLPPGFGSQLVAVMVVTFPLAMQMLAVVAEMQAVVHFILDIP